MTHRSDLFGFSDLVAVKEGEPLVFLQVTSSSNVPSRLTKILEETTGSGQWETPLRDIAKAVIISGAQIIIEGWAKNKSRRYECRDLPVTLELLNSTDPKLRKEARKEALKKSLVSRG